MFRPAATSGKTVTSNNNNGKQSNNSNESPHTTIREIRSRHVSSTTSSPSRQLLVQRRQATSMERLNSGASTVSSSSTTTDREKGSPSSGSSNSINNSSSSPQRGSSSVGGLNRTASRVSRFRSAKAVFERLSNNSGTRPERPSAPEKPKGTVASRYAAAAAARATTHAASSSTTSSRTRFAGGPSSLSRSQESGKSASNIEINRSSTHNSPLKNESSSHPKPQPRVNSYRTSTTANTSSSNDAAKNTNNKTSPTSIPSRSPAHQAAKPPPKDLIDKIVLEIAKEPDSDCTIQDLSNCDISGIPETLDFDRCFQDVEMMTEEEARKLLSRKPSPTPQAADGEAELRHETRVENETETARVTADLVDQNKSDEQSENKEILKTSNLSIESQQQQHQPDQTSTAINKCTNSNASATSTVTTTTTNTTPTTVVKSKVRFSEEPVKIFDTFAVSDYDRRNDDIDPAAASAEYEIEKMKERKGIKDSDDDEADEDNEEGEGKQDGNVGMSATPDKNSNNFIQQHQTISSHDNLTDGAVRNAPAAPPLPQSAPHDSSDGNAADQMPQNQDTKYEEEQTTYSKEYIESLERELSLKHILEQNLRDLQSQYYEAVKESDEYKSKFTEIEQNFQTMSGKFENSKNELTDTREQTSQLEKQLNDIKESSQTLEKKYHRAKRIIKDMQSREQSFNRREQLYQQKLDEIEYELGVLIESIDRTIYEDGLKFYALTDNNNSINVPNQKQAQLDVFGLIRQMLNNFSANQSTQNPQIKQRVVSILEQQLANLMIITNGNAAVAGTVSVNSNPNQPNATTKTAISNDQIYSSANDSKNNQNQVHNYASHRLSQPNLPHPVGVGGQPTKMFHGLNPVPMPIMLNEPSPPQSVNSYPSSNSLNSLNNNNNNNNNSNINNNNTIMTTKMRELPSISDLQLNLPSLTPSTTAAVAPTNEEKFEPVADIQVPFQTNEWHDKLVSEWTTTQVSTWLLALGLDQYISKFEDRNVNGQSLINLDSTVLKGLGVLNSADRNLLKKKIRELRVEMEKERKLIEKKLKENLKDKSKNKTNGNNRADNRNDMQQNKPSWKRGLLS